MIHVREVQLGQLYLDTEEREFYVTEIEDAGFNRVRLHFSDDVNSVTVDLDDQVRYALVEPDEVPL